MKNIYLLDDSKIVTELLKFDLQNEFNCKVTAFENGNDLLDNIYLKPDIIILDHFIDNEYKDNGLKILKKIKAIDPSLATIIFTGQHDMKLAVDFIHYGANDYIDKNQDSFLEDMNKAIKTIFDYKDTQQKINKIDKVINLNKKHFLIISIIFVLLISIVWFLNVIL